MAEIQAASRAKLSPTHLFGDRTLADYARLFREQGVVHIPGALSSDELTLVEEAYAWRLANPGPSAIHLYPDAGAQFFQDKGDSSHEPVFRSMLAKTIIGDIVAALFDGGPVWYLEEQLFYKEGGEHGTRRTAWHQDNSYQTMSGVKAAVVWIGLDKLAPEHTLEVVRRSHLGPLYNTSKLDPSDDTAPFRENGLPRLPAVEKDRARFDILSTAFEPSDLLIFHAQSLHGGGSTAPGARRRSLTLRFVGDDALKLEQPLTVAKMHAASEGVAQPERRALDLDRFFALPVGAPVSQACPTLVRKPRDHISQDPTDPA